MRTLSLVCAFLASLFHNIECSSTLSDLKSSFRNPPRTSGTGTYYQLMNGWITKAGITADFEAFVELGHTRVMVLEAGLGLPEGPVKFASDEWYDALEWLCEEGERVGIDVVLYNGAGYSATGGPWVTAEQSMQHLVWTESKFTSTGQNHSVLNIPQPYTKGNYYRDVATVAYPSLAEDAAVPLFRDAVANAMYNENVPLPTSLIQGIDPLSRIRTNNIMLTLKEPYMINAVAVYRFPEPYQDPFDGPRDFPPGDLTLYSSSDGNTWTKSGVLSCPALRSLEAPCVLTMPAPANATFYKLNATNPTYIIGLDLQPAPRLPGWSIKAHGAPGTPGAMTFLPASTSAVDPSKVINVTEFMDGNGTLSWSPPDAGAWTVLRFGHTATGQDLPATGDSSAGLVIDLFSKSAVDFQFENYLSPLFSRLNRFIHSSFSGVEIDSYEAGMQDWSTTFPEEFLARRGYDILPYLPAVTGRLLINSNITERFLWDFRQTHGELMRDNYYGYIRSRVNDHGLSLFGEPYGDGPFDTYMITGVLDFSMGEIWAHDTYGAPSYLYMSETAAHQTDRGLVPAETYTGQPLTTRFTEHPYSLKYLGDRSYTAGVTQSWFHTAVLQPEFNGFPGMTFGPFGTHLDRNSGFLNQSTGWSGYNRRVQHVLRNGSPVMDVAILKGEQIEAAPYDPYLTFGVPTSFNGDALGRDQFLALSASRGTAVAPSGLIYPVLALPNLQAASPEIMQKALQLASADVPIVLPASPPNLAIGAANNDSATSMVILIAADLWALNSSTVFVGASIGQGLTNLGILPDFEYNATTNAGLAFIHRRIEGEGDVYFVSNQIRRAETIEAVFGVQGTPSLWNAETGEQLPAPAWNPLQDGRTAVFLPFNEIGSWLVVFERDLEESDHVVSVSFGNETLLGPQVPPSAAPYADIVGDWTVHLWIKPETINFNFGQGYIFFPPSGSTLYGSGHSCAGLTGGTNGITIRESGTSLATILTADTPLGGWTHVALSYSANTPTLYVNGAPSPNQTAKASSFKVHPGLNAPWSSAWSRSQFQGDFTPPILFNRPLTPQEVQSVFGEGLPPPATLPAISLISSLKGTSALFGANGTFDFVTSSGRSVSKNINEVEVISVNSPWTVSFPPGKGAPSSIVLDKLQSLHLHSDDGVKYFSGSATWSTKVSVPSLSKSRRLVLDLGRIENIAEVSVNGQSIGILWKPPYRLDITNFSTTSKDVQLSLAVIVTNLWPNRLIGDERLYPAENEYAIWGNITAFPEWFINGQPKQGNRTTFSTWQHYRANDTLYEAGLLGPVTLTAAVWESIL